MRNFWQNIKSSWIKSFIFVLLFGGLIFIALFYVVNLDLCSGSKNQALISASKSINLDEEIKQRLGTISLSMENYTEWAKRYGLDNSNNNLDADSDRDSLPNYLEYVYGTNPLKADTDGDGFSDNQEIINGYDPDAPGDAKPQVDIIISKINIDAPMVWSQSEIEKDMLTDLEKGVSHFYHSAAPGQNGNAVVSGHSSNYIWAKGDFNYIFRDLNNLEPGDNVTVKSIQDNGRVIIYSYKVTEKFITVANDEKIFAETQNPTLTLSTCWPIGTNLRRLIVKAELIR